MSKITLVCTMHSEVGLCNKNELFKIIAAIAPEVIFEELRPNDHGWLYRDKSRYTLEMEAICSYLKARPAMQVPVDNYEIPESFARNMNILHDYVRSHSAKYCEADDKVYQLTSDRGFQYLNSQEFIAHRKYAEELFEEAVVKSGREDFRKMQSTWNDQLQSREESMLENIYTFGRNYTFTAGVFLIGAGHMATMVKGIQHRMEAEANLIDWNIWNGSACAKVNVQGT